MTHRLIFLLPCFLFSLVVTSQEAGFLVKGIVLDETSGAPLDAVNIAITGIENRGSSTDSSGRFFIKIEDFPVTLKFSHVGYAEKVIELTASKSKFLTVRLSPAITSLPEISVSAQRKIDTVFHEPLNVVDYAFKNDQVILLIYKNVFEKYQLATLDKNEKVLATLSLTDYRPASLFTSCLGNVYLTTDLGVYPILTDAASISLGKFLDHEYFESAIQDCVLATDSFVYYTRYYYQGQAKQHFGISKNNTDQIITFPLIQHEHNIDLLIEETGNVFPRSGDVWQENVSLQFASLRNAPYGLKGMMKIFYPQLYAPIIKRDSMLCIFNHQESELQYFDSAGTKVSGIPIQYHRLKKWNKELIFDIKNETAFTTFDSKWGLQLCRIDMETGKLSEAIPIDRDFIEKLKIHDGCLYFLHRNPYLGAQTRMLQKMRLD